MAEDEVQITFGLTGEDWEPTEATRYYAQVLPEGESAFGSTARQAVLNLMEKINV